MPATRRYVVACARVAHEHEVARHVRVFAGCGTQALDAALGPMADLGLHRIEADQCFELGEQLLEVGGGFRPSFGPAPAAAAARRAPGIGAVPGGDARARGRD
jgi:hypothetical protein